MTRCFPTHLSPHPHRHVLEVNTLTPHAWPGGLNQFQTSNTHTHAHPSHPLDVSAARRCTKRFRQHIYAQEEHVRQAAAGPPHPPPPNHITHITHITHHAAKVGDTQIGGKKVFCSFHKARWNRGIYPEQNRTPTTRTCATAHIHNMSKSAVITASAWAAGSVVLAAYIITLSKATMSCCLAAKKKPVLIQSPLTFKTVGELSGSAHACDLFNRDQRCKRRTSRINDSIFAHPSAFSVSCVNESSTSCTFAAIVLCWWFYLFYFSRSARCVCVVGE